LGFTCFHSDSDNSQDLEKFKIVKTVLISKGPPSSTKGFRKSNFFGQPSLVKPILIEIDNFPIFHWKSLKLA
jgi:hypothetical protein